MAQKKISDIKAINVHAGHNPDGKIACGAIGLVKESTEARIVKDKVITMLRILGYTTYDCTVDNGTSQNDVLKKIVAKCNAHKADLDVSIHFNSGAGDKTGNGKTTGVEVLVLPGSTLKNIASGICDSISDLGFRNRGVKERTDLYVLNKTNASALLIECCFVDDADDVKLYNSTKMAEAIVYGITGRRYTYGSDQQVSSTPATPATGKTPAYKVGQIYALQTALRVRTGPGTNYTAKTHSQLTTDGQKHDTDKNGCLDKGTKITCQEVRKVDSDIWIRCPSGWVAAYYSGKAYIK